MPQTKSIKMGLKDLKVFPMDRISVTKVPGRTNTPHYLLQYLVDVSTFSLGCPHCSYYSPSRFAVGCATR